MEVNQRLYLSPSLGPNDGSTGHRIVTQREKVNISSIPLPYWFTKWNELGSLSSSLK